MTTHGRPLAARGETSAAGEALRARERLSEVLRATVYLEPGLQSTSIVPKLTIGQAIALADEIEAGRAAVVEVVGLRAALVRGVAVCDGLIAKASDPDDHSEENMLARVCLPIVGLIRDALAAPDADQAGGAGDG